jgi:hypothetical protein
MPSDGIASIAAMRPATSMDVTFWGLMIIAYQQTGWIRTICFVVASVVAVILLINHLLDARD